MNKKKNRITTYTCYEMKEGGSPKEEKKRSQITDHRDRRIIQIIGLKIRNGWKGRGWQPTTGAIISNKLIQRPSWTKTIRNRSQAENYTCGGCWLHLLLCVLFILLKFIMICKAVMTRFMVQSGGALGICMLHSEAGTISQEGAQNGRFAQLLILLEAAIDYTPSGSHSLDLRSVFHQS